MFSHGIDLRTLKHNGDISALILAFREQGFLDDIPEAQAQAISKQVLSAIAVLRNELGGHGQGDGSRADVMG